MANGEFAMKPTICRNSGRQPGSAFPCFRQRHPLSGTVGCGRPPLHLSSHPIIHWACWGQFLMANVVVVGSQWGDEGKGKIVDWLSEQADIVVRFQGGHNAGHTQVINGTTYKLSMLP